VLGSFLSKGRLGTALTRNEDVLLLCLARGVGAVHRTSLLSDRRFEKFVSCPVGVVGLSVTPQTVRGPTIGIQIYARAYYK
jgi:hypothetical protein